MEQVGEVMSRVAPAVALLATCVSGLAFGEWSRRTLAASEAARDPAVPSLWVQRFESDARWGRVMGISALVAHVFYIVARVSHRCP